ncbi:MAG: hypothetical protein GWN58_56855 [Anaerolineae bacterium]|nr:hypothetical protein [Anaerolineae bacterium]
MIGFPAEFGVMTSAAHGMIPLGIQEGRRWAYDNECFGDSFDPRRFLDGIQRLAASEYREDCLFVVAPDVVGDARATLHLYGEWEHRIKATSFPVAFVAQDGQEALDFPLAFDWLFIGGTTEWKLSDAADECIRRAKRLGKPVHVGRVNSIKRIRHFQIMEVDSVDGTFPIYEPDTARARLAKPLAQPPLLSLLHQPVSDRHHRR